MGGGGYLSVYYRMENGLVLLNVILTGLLALERGVMHCGSLSGVRHLTFSCSRCLELSLSREASKAWSLSEVGSHQRRASYDIETNPHTPPVEEEMNRRGSLDRHRPGGADGTGNAPKGERGGSAHRTGGGEEEREVSWAGGGSAA